MRFAILSEGSYFVLIAGSEELIRELVGNPDEWWREFEQYIENPKYSHECREYLKGVHRAHVPFKC